MGIPGWVLSGLEYFVLQLDGILGGLFRRSASPWRQIGKDGPLFDRQLVVFVAMCVFLGYVVNELTLQLTTELRAGEKSPADLLGIEKVIPIRLMLWCLISALLYLCVRVVGGKQPFWPSTALYVSVLAISYLISALIGVVLYLFVLSLSHWLDVAPQHLPAIGATLAGAHPVQTISVVFWVISSLYCVDLAGRYNAFSLTRRCVVAPMIVLVLALNIVTAMVLYETGGVFGE